MLPVGLNTELPARVGDRTLNGYTVTAEGRVRGPSGVWRKPCLMSSGYLAISVWNGKRSASEALHVMVCTTFHGARPSSNHLVRHLDGDKFNNRADNLTWGTAKENHADIARHGRRQDQSGEKGSAAKLTWEIVAEIRQRYAAGGVSVRALAVDYGVSGRAVHKLLTGQTWKEATNDA